MTLPLRLSFACLAFAFLIPTANAQPYRAVVLETAPGELWTLGNGAGDAYFSGYGALPNTSFSGQTRAVLFTESSFLDVTPEDKAGAVINDSYGDQHVGSATPAEGYPAYAYLWIDATPYNLHPAGFGVSELLGTGGGKQVGYAIASFYCSECGLMTSKHAGLWSGNAESFEMLHSHLHDFSAAYGTDGVQQVGQGRVVATGFMHALLWNGPSSSAIDLHPSDAYGRSLAKDVSEGQQLGYVLGEATGGEVHAALWSGTASSFQDLNPEAYIRTDAFAIRSGVEVGTGTLLNELGRYRALAWRGSAASVIDLHAVLPDEFQSWNSSARDIDAAGNIVGLLAVDERIRPVIWFRTEGGGVVSSDPGLPLQASLGPAFPNPLRNSGSFVLALPQRAPVQVTIYDLNGRMVKAIASGSFEAGSRTITWDGRDAAGGLARAGVYFARLTVGGNAAGERKFVLAP